MKFFDLQTGEYSSNDTLDGMILTLLDVECYCTGEEKCYYCYVLENLSSISEEEKIKLIEEFDFKVEK